MIQLTLILLFVNIIIYFNIKIISKKINIFAIKYERSLRSKLSIPVIGGTILYINFFVIFIFLLLNKKYDFTFFPLMVSYREIFAFFIPITILYLTGLYDDKYKVSVTNRLLIFLLCLLISTSLDQDLIINELKFSFYTEFIYLDNISLLFTLLSFLLAINAFNLFDGINLQLSIYTFLIILYLLMINNSFYMVSILLVPIIFFIILNFKNAAILGDGGSLTLGFLISYLIIKYYKFVDNFPADHIFILLMIPGIDMLRLFVFRIGNGQSPFFGDYNHIHHILHKNFSLNKTLMILHSTFILLILLLIFNVHSLIIITSYIIFYALVIYYLRNKINDN